MRFIPNEYHERGVVGPEQWPQVTPEQAEKEAQHLAHKCLLKLESNLEQSSTTEADIYTGYAGVLWSFWLVNRHDPAKKDAIASVVAKMHSLASSAQSRSGSFLCGRFGIHVLRLIMANQQATNMSDSVDAIKKTIAQNLAKPIQDPNLDELFVGRAGHLVGLALMKHFQVALPVSNAIIGQIIQRILESGQYFASSYTRVGCPLMYTYHDTFYFGMAHGLAGVLFAMLQFPEILAELAPANDLIRQSVDFLLEQATPAETHNLVSSVDRMPPRHKTPEMGNELVHWCHGATGAIQVYAAAWLHFGQEKYLQACRGSAQVIWQRGLLKKGPGICHGIAGSGYGLLLMGQLLRHHHADEEEAELWFRRANLFGALAMDFCKQEGLLNRPDRPYSLFEGLAGTALFYHDLAMKHPQQAHFPLLPLQLLR